MKKKLDLIEKVFSLSGVVGVYNKNIDVNAEKFECSSLVLNNQFDEIEKVINNNPISCEDIYMKAYYMAVLGEWKNSFNLYNKLIDKAYQEKTWLYYYLAQLNAYLLARLILSINEQLVSYYSYLVLGRTYKVFDDSFIDKLSSFTKLQSVKSIYAGMPESFKVEYHALKWIFSEPILENEKSAISGLQNQAISDIKAGTIFLGQENVFSKMYDRMNDDVKFIYENAIFINLSPEFKNIVKIGLKPLVEGIIHEQKKDSSKGLFGELGFNGNDVYSVDYYDFIYLVKFHQLKDIQRIFRNIDTKKLKIDDLDKIEEYIIRTLKFFEQETTDQEISVLKYVVISEEIKNVLYVSSYLNFKESNFRYLIDFILNTAFERDVNIGIRILYIIRLLYNNKKDDVVINNIESFLIGKLVVRIDQSFEEYMQGGYSYKELVNSIMNIDNEYKFKRLSNSIMGLETLNEKQLNYSFSLLSGINEDAQTKVISMKKNFTTQNLLDLEALGLLSLVKDYELIVYNNTKSLVKLMKEDEKIGRRTIPPRTINLSGILCFLGYLNKEKMKEFLGVCDEYDFLVSPSDFDFNTKFDCSWLLHYTPRFVEKISSNSLMKEKIKISLKKRFSGKLEEELIKIYFKYFED